MNQENRISLNSLYSDFEYSDEPNTLALWGRLLFMANQQETERKGMVISRGQLVTTASRLSIESGLSRQNIRTALSKLEKCGYITIKPTNKFSLITICKYEDYILV